MKLRYAMLIALISSSVALSATAAPVAPAAPAKSFNWYSLTPVMRDGNQIFQDAEVSKKDANGKEVKVGDVVVKETVKGGSWKPTVHGGMVFGTTLAAAASAGYLVYTYVQFLNANPTLEFGYDSFCACVTQEIQTPAFKVALGFFGVSSAWLLVKGGTALAQKFGKFNTKLEVVNAAKVEAAKTAAALDAAKALPETDKAAKDAKVAAVKTAEDADKLAQAAVKTAEAALVVVAPAATPAAPVVPAPAATPDAAA